MAAPKSKLKELVYSTQSSDFIKGRAYSNPRFFSTPRSDVSKVFLVGDWPEIQKAYEDAGVPVERIDQEAVTSHAPAAAAAVTSTVKTDAERSAVVIPDDWAGLPWVTREQGALTMRALASQFSEKPVLNKADATAAIEAEIARRAAEVQV